MSLGLWECPETLAPAGSEQTPGKGEGMMGRRRAIGNQAVADLERRRQCKRTREKKGRKVGDNSEGSIYFRGFLRIFNSLWVKLQFSKNTGAPIMLRY